jgi:hypothetical protein
MGKSTQEGYRKWMPHNLKALKKKCRYQISNIAQPKLVAMLRDVAQKIANEIDSITSVPNYTGNLRDSHGVGVYLYGTLSAYIPTQTATKAQSSSFHNRNEYNIWGTEYVSQALQDATTDFADGIWIVLFAAVPYAFYINENHESAGFFGEIADTIVEEVRSGLTQLKVKNIPNITTYGQL